MKVRQSHDRGHPGADVLQVVQAIGALYDLTPADLESTRAGREVLRGGFADRVVWAGNALTTRPE